MVSAGTDIISFSQAKIQQVGSASVRFVRKVWKDSAATCFQLMHLELTWISNSLLVPFVAEPPSDGRKVAVLTSAKGPRKVATMILHCIIVMRILILFRLLFQGKLQVTYKGNLTVDVCFAAANILLAISMGYAWFRVWLNLDYVVWTHNSVNHVGSRFARCYLDAPNLFTSKNCSPLIRFGLICLIASFVNLPITGLVGRFLYSDSVLYLVKFIEEVMMEPDDIVMAIGELIDMLFWVTLTMGNVFLCSALFNFGSTLILLQKNLMESSEIPWRRKLGYYSQLAIMLKSMNAILGGLLPCVLFSLFMMVMAYNGILFNFVSRMENPFLCCVSVVSSIFATLLGFCICQFAEIIQTLSESTIKGIQSAVAESCLKGYRPDLKIGEKEFKRSTGATLQARRFFPQRLALGIGAFGTIKPGDSVIWLQQIIENTVTAIFTVSIGNRRWLW